MNIEKIKLTELKPLDNNVRNHSYSQINELIRSLNQFGQTRAIVIDEENNILAGNGLFMAMTERGDETADVHRITGLTSIQKKKLVLTDNKLYTLGTDNYDMIDKYLQEITIEAGDFDIAGFDKKTLKSMAEDIETGLDDDGYNYDIPDIDEMAQEAAEELENIDRVQIYTEETKPPQAAAEGLEMASQTEREDNKKSEEPKKYVLCPHCGEKIYIV